MQQLFGQRSHAAATARYALAMVIVLGCGGDGGSNGSDGGTEGTGPCADITPPACEAELEAKLRYELGVRESTISIIEAECREGFISPEVATFAGPLLTLAGPYCACETDDQVAYRVSPEPGGCAVRGHAHACVMEHGAFDGCDPGDSTACDALCDELQERIDEDGATAQAYRVRSARCTEKNFEGNIYAQCDTGVLEIEGFCYPVEGSIDWDSWQSCDLDDETILEARTAPLPDCDAFSDSVPATAMCTPVCDDAAVCHDAEGCWHGDKGAGFGASGRGVCMDCRADDQCSTDELCVAGACLVAANAACRSDDDCWPTGSCVVEGRYEPPNEGRGNANVIARCIDI